MKKIFIFLFFLIPLNVFSFDVADNDKGILSYHLGQSIYSDKDDNVIYFNITNDFKHYIYQIKKGCIKNEFTLSCKYSIYYDGNKIGPDFNNQVGIVLLNNGDYTLFGDLMVIKNGNIYHINDSNYIYSIQSSNDGNYGFIDTIDGNKKLIINGNIVEQDNFSFFRISDGGIITYVKEENNKYHYVINGIKSMGYDEIVEYNNYYSGTEEEKIKFSSDGKNYFYIGKIGKDNYIINEFNKYKIEGNFEYGNIYNNGKDLVYSTKIYTFNSDYTKILSKDIKTFVNGKMLLENEIYNIELGKVLAKDYSRVEGKGKLDNSYYSKGSDDFGGKSYMNVYNKNGKNIIKYDNKDFLHFDYCEGLNYFFSDNLNHYGCYKDSLLESDNTIYIDGKKKVIERVSNDIILIANNGEKYMSLGVKYLEDKYGKDKRVFNVILDGVNINKGEDIYSDLYFDENFDNYILKGDGEQVIFNGKKLNLTSGEILKILQTGKWTKLIDRIKKTEVINLDKLKRDEIIKKYNNSNEGKISQLIISQNFKEYGYLGFEDGKITFIIKDVNDSVVTESKDTERSVEIIKEKSEKIKDIIYKKYGEDKFKKIISQMYLQNPEKVKKLKASLDNKMENVVDNDKLSQNQKIDQIATYYAISSILGETMKDDDDAYQILEDLLSGELFK